MVDTNGQPGWCATNRPYPPEDLRGFPVRGADVARLTQRLRNSVGADDPDDEGLLDVAYALEELPIFPKRASLRLTIMQRRSIADDSNGTHFAAANLEIDGSELTCSWSETISSASHGSDSSSGRVFRCDDEGEEEGSLTDWLDMVAGLNYLEISCHCAGFEAAEAGEKSADTVTEGSDGTPPSDIFGNWDDVLSRNYEFPAQQEAICRRKGYLPQLSPEQLGAMVEARACNALTLAMLRSINLRRSARSSIQLPTVIGGLLVLVATMCFVCGERNLASLFLSVGLLSAAIAVEHAAFARGCRSNMLEIVGILNLHGFKIDWDEQTLSPDVTASWASLSELIVAESPPKTS